MLGASLYGVYAYAYTILVALLVITNSGTDKSVLKYLPQYEDQPRTRQFMLGLAFLTSIVGGLIVCISLLLSAPSISMFTLESDLFVVTLRIFAIIILFEAIIKIINSTFRALEILEYEVFIDRILKPALRVTAVAVAFYLELSFIGVMATLLIASGLTLLIAVWLFLNRLDIRPSLRGRDEFFTDTKSYYNYSLPLVAKDGASVLRSRIDILMVGFFLSATAVGVYNVAILIATLLILPLSAFNQLFPPIISRLYSNNKYDELNELFSTVTRWTFTITLLLGIGVIVYRVQILGLFGEEFIAGSTVLVLFVAGQLVNNAAGPSAYVLMMTEHQYTVLFNQWVFGVLNVVLNYVFIIEFGLIGAAVATAGTLALLNITRIVEVWYFERLFPYTIGFLKPLAAGGAAFVVMYSVETAINGMYALIVGGALGTVVYIVVLFGLGIEENDRVLVEEIVS